MEKHKFVTGDRVRVAKKLAYSAAEPGIYTIVRVLPVAGFGLQYRARKDEESQEYVLNEEALQLAKGGILNRWPDTRAD
jgi:hypothetical protein